jgi:hypothetical protein
MLFCAREYKEKVIFFQCIVLVMRKICPILHLFIIYKINFMHYFSLKFFIFFKLHSKFMRSESTISRYVVKEICMLIVMYWLIAACGGTVQVNTTTRALRPVTTTDTFIYCGWLILGSPDQQIQLSITSLTLTPCTHLSSSNTSVTSCSCSYLEVRFNHSSCKMFVY